MPRVSITLFVALLTALLLALPACKKRTPPKRKRVPLSKAEVQRRIKFATPRCNGMCTRGATLCKKHFEAKKRKHAAAAKKGKKQARRYRPFAVKRCQAQCVSSFIRRPRLVGYALACVAGARTCEEVRNCNRCAKRKCPKPGARRKKPAAGKPGVGKPTAKPAKPAKPGALKPKPKSAAPAKKPEPDKK